MAGWVSPGHAISWSSYAKGDYLIFTDADTLHFPDTVSKALAAIYKTSFDGISVYPKQLMVTFTERMLVSFIGMGLFTMMPLALVKKQRVNFSAQELGSFSCLKGKHILNLGA